MLRRLDLGLGILVILVVIVIAPVTLTDALLVLTYSI
jgi:hypothetical protein